MQCPFCGYENPNDSDWCGKCGNGLSAQNTVHSQTQQPRKKTTKYILPFVAIVIILIVIIILQNPQWLFSETEKAAVMAIHELKDEVPELEDIQLEEIRFSPSDKNDGGTFYFNYRAQVNGHDKEFSASVFYYSNDRGKYCLFWYNNEGYRDLYFSNTTIDKDKIQKAIK